MALRAHVLLQVEPGCSGEAAAYVAGLPLVDRVATTEGAYDVIATVQADSEAAMRGTLALARRTPGLFALRLCHAALPDEGTRACTSSTTASVATR